MLRTEPKDNYDQAPSAVLELVDGPRDLRFAITAAAVARDRALGKPHTDLTQRQIEKVTRFRPDGAAQLEDMVRRTAKLRLDAPGAQMDDLPTGPWERSKSIRPQAHKPRHGYFELAPKSKESIPGQRKKTPEIISLDAKEEEGKGRLTLLSKGR